MVNLWVMFCYYAFIMKAYSQEQKWDIKKCYVWYKQMYYQFPNHHGCIILVITDNILSNSSWSWASEPFSSAPIPYPPHIEVLLVVVADQTTTSLHLFTRCLPWLSLQQTTGNPVDNVRPRCRVWAQVTTASGLRTPDHSHHSSNIHKMGSREWTMP